MNNNLTPVLISGVSCYEQDGTAYLRLEDVARGLGFTQTKNGLEYVRWETIEKYLVDLGFSQQVGKDDYIPENIFYRLAMKAKNETAEKFQALVADEIIPSIRKTGSYAVSNVSHTGLQALDLIVQSLHEQHDAMNRLQVNMTSQGAEIERLKAQNELNREAFSLNQNNWRDNANAVVRKIVFARTGGMTSGQKEVFEDTWNEVYSRMDARGLNMKRRFANLQHDFPKKKINKLEVIDRASDRKRLINDLRSVLCEMCVYYGVRLTTEQARTITESQPSEQTSLFAAQTRTTTAGHLTEA